MLKVYSEKESVLSHCANVQLSFDRVVIASVFCTENLTSKSVFKMF
jgi:hypothetical protein